MDCATSPSPATAAVLRTLALVGHPNVGKSVLFHRLTGTYVTVSNYPGTTVEVSRATPRFDREASLLDTPGVLALPSRSDDERATMRALLNEDMRTLIQVGDAKNLRRTLNLTALLAELGVPMVMALNMTDEANARGVTVDDALLWIINEEIERTRQLYPIDHRRSQHTYATLYQAVKDALPFPFSIVAFKIRFSILKIGAVNSVQLIVLPGCFFQYFSGFVVSLA